VNPETPPPPPPPPHALTTRDVVDACVVKVPVPAVAYTVLVVNLPAPPAPEYPE